jgi:peroxiredoxin Q/BCP
MLKEGDDAPVFGLDSDNGEVVLLSNYRGSPVVVYFYPKDNTPGCTVEAVDFSEKKPEFDALGVKVIGISPDTVKSHTNFRNKHNLSIVLVADTEKKAANSYGVWVEKKNYGRTYMGIERTTFLLDADGKIANIWRKVRVKGHVDDVLAAAQNLVGGQ